MVIINDRTSFFVSLFYNLLCLLYVALYVIFCNYLLFFCYLGLRERINTLFLQYCKTPLFNPEIARLLKVYMKLLFFVLLPNSFTKKIHLFLITNYDLESYAKCIHNTSY